MLIYHPVHDVNYSVFRIVMVLESTQHTGMDLDLFRLVDFYLLFPHLLKEIKPFPSELVSFRKTIKQIHEPYELVNNVKRIMYDLESIQTTAIQNLLAKNLIDIASFKNKKLKRTDELLPDSLYEKIKTSDTVKEEWFRMLINEFPTVNFLRSKGLKARSGMMEFSYDVEAV